MACDKSPLDERTDRPDLRPRAVDLVRMVGGQGLKLAAIGLAIGLVGALAVGQPLSGMLYGISPGMSARMPARCWCSASRLCWRR